MEKELNRQQYFSGQATLKEAGAFFSEENKDIRFTFPGDFSHLKKNLQNFLITHFEKFFGVPFTQKNSFFSNEEWDRLLAYLKSEDVFEDLTLSHFFNDVIKLYKFTFTHSGVSGNNSDGFSPNNNWVGTGVSNDANEAISKAVGELLERRAFLIYNEKNFFTSSIKDLQEKKTNFMHPRLLGGLPEGYKNISAQEYYTDKNTFYWVKGRELLGDKEILIPAQLVYWTYNYNHNNYTEPRFRESNTNGAGGGFTKNQAILSGLYEVIERDAFLTHWLHKKTPKIIDNKSIKNKEITDLINKAERYQFKVYFLDATTEFDVPVSICALVDQSGIGPKVSFGSSAGFNTKEVLKKAFFEANQVYNWVRANENEEKQEIIFDTYQPFQDNSIGQLERMFLWSKGETFKNLEFLFSGKSTSYDEFNKDIEFKNEEELVYFLAQKMGNYGEEYKPLFYDPENEIAKKCGYFCVKVVVPGLLPLYLKEGRASQGFDRLKSVARNMKWSEKSEINLFPHPIS